MLLLLYIALDKCIPEQQVVDKGCLKEKTQV